MEKLRVSEMSSEDIKKLKLCMIQEIVDLYIQYRAVLW